MKARLRIAALLILAALGAAAGSGCDMNAQPQASNAPKPIRCGAGTVDTGIRCEPGHCR